MARRLIGTGTTNAQGIAPCNATYTGVGAGKLQIIAVSGDLESETYELTDCIFLDVGTSSNYETWGNWTGYEPIITRTDYTALTIDTENNKTDARMYKGALTSNICIEWDMRHSTNSNTNIFATLRNTSVTVLANLYLNRLELSTGEWHHMKLEISETGFTLSSTSTTKTYTAAITGITRFYFQVTEGELDYKNFIIYPI